MEKHPIKKRYIFISVIVFFLGVMLLIIPMNKNREELTPKNLLLSISNEDRFIYPDQLAKLVISEDSTLQLIDVREPQEYAKYSLPGALNIPLAALLDKDESGDYLWGGYFNDENKTTILFSNGTVYANQAWMLTKRLKFSNNYVLKGGLNRFFKDIILAQKPKNSAPESEHKLYSFRKGAAMFFGGGSTSSDINNSEKKIKTVPVKKKKQTMEEGGC